MYVQLALLVMIIPALDAVPGIMPMDACLYKGQKYQQSVTWYDGCDFKCTCENATISHYTCIQRCMTYDKLPPNCVLKLPSNDPCCKIPICTDTPVVPLPTTRPVTFRRQGTGGLVSIFPYKAMSRAGGTGRTSFQIKSAGRRVQQGAGLGVSAGGSQAGSSSIVRSGLSRMPPRTVQAVLMSGAMGVPMMPGCEYKRRIYATDARWVDGCDFNCHCENGKTGYYVCKNRCPIYKALPPGCLLSLPPGEECCKTPDASCLAMLQGGTVSSARFTRTLTLDGGVGTGSAALSGQVKSTLKTGSLSQAGTGAGLQGQISVGEKLSGKLQGSSMRTSGMGAGTLNIGATSGKITSLARGLTGAGVSGGGLLTRMGLGGDIAMTAAKGQGCIYKGKVYSTAETWVDGCKFTCRCEDASTGLLRCRDRCLQYEALPPGCQMVLLAGEPCCKVPVCPSGAGATFVDGTVTMQRGDIKTTQTDGMGGAFNNMFIKTTAMARGCRYKGQVYGDGATWVDGCDYDCRCENGTTGYYVCKSRCPIYKNLPPGCQLKLPPGEKCCPKPDARCLAMTNGGLDLVVGRGAAKLSGSAGQSTAGVSGTFIAGGGVSAVGTEGRTGQLRPGVSGTFVAGGGVTAVGTEGRTMVGKERGFSQFGTERGGSMVGTSGGVSGRQDMGISAASVAFTSRAQGGTVTMPGGQSILMAGTRPKGVLVEPVTRTRVRGCRYKGHVYGDGATWVDGCDYDCRCENGTTGYYVCKSRCPIYKNLPAGCQLKLPPGEECCLKPDCSAMGNGKVSMGRGVSSAFQSGAGTATVISTSETAHAGAQAGMVGGHSAMVGGKRGLEAFQTSGIGVDKLSTIGGVATFAGGEQQAIGGGGTGAVAAVDVAETLPMVTRTPNLHRPLTVKEVEAATKPGSIQGVGMTSSAFLGRGCMYKGRTYPGGVRWVDGCDYECRCEDGNTGYYVCKNRCPIYKDVPKECQMKLPPGEECCMKPVCTAMAPPTDSGNIFGSTIGIGDRTNIISDKQFTGRVGGNTMVDMGGSATKLSVEGQVSGSITEMKTPPHLVVTKVDVLGTGSATDKSNVHVDVVTTGEAMSKPSVGGFLEHLTVGRVFSTDTQIIGRGGTDATSVASVHVSPTQSLDIRGKPVTVVGLKDVGAGIKTSVTQGVGAETTHVGGFIDIGQQTVGQSKIASQGVIHEQMVGERQVDTGMLTGTQEAGASSTAGQASASGTVDVDIWSRGREGLVDMGLSQAGRLDSRPLPVPGVSGGFSLLQGNLALDVRQPTMEGKGCVYKGTRYAAGESWNDGCDYKCQCLNADSGKYICRDRCHTYRLVPGCVMVLPRGEQCCKFPDCSKAVVGGRMFGSVGQFDMSSSGGVGSDVRRIDISRTGIDTVPVDTSGTGLGIGKLDIQRTGGVDVTGAATGAGMFDTSRVDSGIGRVDVTGATTGAGMFDTSRVDSGIGRVDVTGAATGAGMFDTSGVDSGIGRFDITGATTSAGMFDTSGVDSGIGRFDITEATTGAGMFDTSGVDSGIGRLDITGAATGAGMFDTSGVDSGIGRFDITGAATGAGMFDTSGVDSGIGRLDITGAATGAGMFDTSRVDSGIGRVDVTGATTGAGMFDTSGMDSGIGRLDITGAATGPGMFDTSRVDSGIGRVDVTGATTGAGMFDTSGMDSGIGRLDITGAATGPGMFDTSRVDSGIGRFDITGAATGAGMFDTSRVDSGIGRVDVTGAATGAGMFDTARVDSGIGRLDVTGAATRDGMFDTSRVDSGIGRFDITGAATGAGIFDTSGPDSGIGRVDITGAATGAGMFDTSRVDSGIGRLDITGAATGAGMFDTSRVDSGIGRVDVTGATTGAGMFDTSRVDSGIGRVDVTGATTGAGMFDTSRVDSGIGRLDITDAATGAGMFDTSRVDSGIGRLDITGATTGAGMFDTSGMDSGIGQVDVTEATTGAGMFDTSRVDTGIGRFDISGAAIGAGMFDTTGLDSGIGRVDVTGATTGAGMFDTSRVDTGIGRFDITGAATGAGMFDTSGVDSGIGRFDITGAATGAGMFDTSGVDSGIGRLDITGAATGAGMFDTSRVDSGIGRLDITGAATGAGMFDTSRVDSGIGRVDVTGATTGAGMFDTSGMDSGIGRLDITGAATGPGMFDTSRVDSGIGRFDITGAATGAGIFDTSRVDSGIGRVDVTGAATGAGMFDTARVDSGIGRLGVTGAATRDGMFDTSRVDSGIGRFDITGAATGAGIFDTSGPDSGIGRVDITGAPTGAGMFDTSRVDSGIGRLDITGAATGAGMFDTSRVDSGIGRVDVTGATTGAGMFDTSRVDSGIGRVDVTGATTGAGMFDTSSVDSGIGRLDITGAATGAGMFDTSRVDSGIGRLDITAATTGAGMFDTSGMDSGIGQVDVTEATAGAGMFDTSRVDTGIGRFDISGAATGAGMFDTTGLDSGIGRVDVTGATTGAGMFDTSRVDTGIGRFDITGAATGAGMFDTSRVDSGIGRVDVTGATTGAGMFDTSRVDTGIGRFDITGAATGAGMFDTSRVDSGIGRLDVTGATTGAGMFDTSRVDIGIRRFDVTGAATGAGMFDTSGADSGIGRLDIAGAATGAGLFDTTRPDIGIGRLDIAGAATGAGIVDTSGADSGIGRLDITGAGVSTGGFGTGSGIGILDTSGTGMSATGALQFDKPITGRKAGMLGGLESASITVTGKLDKTAAAAGMTARDILRQMLSTGADTSASVIGGGCIYKSKKYASGESWFDGCDFECHCVNGDTGTYSCTDRCPTYQVQTGCKLVLPPGEACCKDVDCSDMSVDIGGSNPDLIGFGTIGIGATSRETAALLPRAGPDVTVKSVTMGTGCAYKGILHAAGERWFDGCDFECQCLDADTALYRCRDRCPTYKLPPGCILVLPAGEPCCRVPDCSGDGTTRGVTTADMATNLITAKDTSVMTGAKPAVTGTSRLDIFGQVPAANIDRPTADVGMTVASATGMFGGQIPITDSAATGPAGMGNGCMYKGKLYAFMSKWYDGCDFECQCIDGATGQYICKDRCPAIPLRPGCVLVLPVGGECCKVPECFGVDIATGPAMADVTGTITTVSKVSSDLGNVGMDVGAKAQEIVAEISKSELGVALAAVKQTGVDRSIIDIFGGTQMTDSAAITGTFGMNGCMYKGKLYGSQEVWTDGCDFECQCVKADTGFYQCRDRCPTYQLQPGCVVVLPPGEPCCRVPDCSAAGMATGGTMSGTVGQVDVVSGAATTMVDTGPPALDRSTIDIFGSVSTTGTAAAGKPAFVQGCRYNDKLYKAGKSWFDGCDFECQCMDGNTGFYECRDRCPTYQLQPGCVLVLPPGEPCCRVPDCSAAGMAAGGTMSGTVGQVDVVSGAATTMVDTGPPALDRSTIDIFGSVSTTGTAAAGKPTFVQGCRYNGELYKAGESWFDGCDFECQCMDGNTGFYECRDRCRTYKLQPGCDLVLHAGEPCCMVPDCSRATFDRAAATAEAIGSTISVPGQDVLTAAGTGIVGGVVGQVPITGTGDGTDGTITVSTIHTNVTKLSIKTNVQTSMSGQASDGGAVITETVEKGCDYKGSIYAAGTYWFDGCNLECVCEDGNTGHYTCTDICPVVVPPPGCVKLLPPGECCGFIDCSALNIDTSVDVGVAGTNVVAEGKVTGGGTMIPIPIDFGAAAVHFDVVSPVRQTSPPVDKAEAAGILIGMTKDSTMDTSAIIIVPPEQPAVLLGGEVDSMVGLGKPCNINGKQYAPGESWFEGCAMSCRCDKAGSGDASCVSRCPPMIVAPGCIQVVPLGECCPIAECSGALTAPPISISQPDRHVVPVPSLVKVDAVSRSAVIQGDVQSSGQFNIPIPIDFGAAAGNFDVVSPVQQTSPPVDKAEAAGIRIGMTKDSTMDTSAIIIVPPEQPAVLLGGEFDSMVGLGKPCNINGKQYAPGESWFVGCEMSCRCDKAGSGDASCVSRCPPMIVAPGCIQVVPLGDCCPIAECSGALTAPPISISQPDRHVVPVPSLVKVDAVSRSAVIQGDVQSSGQFNIPAPEMALFNGCEYKGKIYAFGESWFDGCDLSCTCDTFGTVKPICNLRCLPVSLPPGCIETLPPGECCIVADCSGVLSNGQIGATDASSMPGSGHTRDSVSQSSIATTGDSMSFDMSTHNKTVQTTQNVINAIDGVVKGCDYMGILVAAGQSWDDACAWTCTCDSTGTGEVNCVERCPTVEVPPGCTEILPPGECCTIVDCTAVNMNDMTTTDHAYNPLQGHSQSLFAGDRDRVNILDQTSNTILKTENTATGAGHSTDSLTVGTDVVIDVGLPDKQHGGITERGQTTSATTSQLDISNIRGVNLLVRESGINTDPSHTAVSIDFSPYIQGVGVQTPNAWPNENAGTIGTVFDTTHASSLEGQITNIPSSAVPYGRVVSSLPGCDFMGMMIPAGQSWDDGCVWTCSCDGNGTGKFTCVDRCPPVQLPSGCVEMLPPGECCKIADCSSVNYVDPAMTMQIDAKTTIPIPRDQAFGVIVSPVPISGTDTATSIGGSMASVNIGNGERLKGLAKSIKMGRQAGHECLYKSKTYQPGHAWIDGCDWACKCDDAGTGVYSCTNLCPTYALEPGCVMVLKPGEECCQVPDCSNIEAGMLSIPTSTDTGIGSIISSVAATGRCGYMGIAYRTGETWFDGCTYKCTCRDEASGSYFCEHRCPAYPENPIGCDMKLAPGEECCPTPDCSNVFSTMVMAQVGGGCIYKGQQYRSDEIWTDGCILICQCDIAQTDLYRCQESKPTTGIGAPVGVGIGDAIGASGTIDVTGGIGSPGTFGIGDGIGASGTIGRAEGIGPSGTVDIGGGIWAQSTIDIAGGIGASGTVGSADGIAPVSPAGTFGILDVMGAPQTVGGFGVHVGAGGVGAIETASSMFTLPGQPTSNIGVVMISGCDYKGTMYAAGATWLDGCDFRCKCTNAEIGQYICNDRCPIYTEVPIGCELKLPHGEECCRKPDCTGNMQHINIDVQGTINRLGANLVSSGGMGVESNRIMSVGTGGPTFMEGLPSGRILGMGETTGPGTIDITGAGAGAAFQGGIGGSTIATSGIVTDVGGGFVTTSETQLPFMGAMKPLQKEIGTKPPGCFYQGKKYLTGDVWHDGCDFECVCENAGTGFYRCHERCPGFVNLPRGCVMVLPPGQECCKRPQCSGQHGVIQVETASGANILDSKIAPAMAIEIQATTETRQGSVPDASRVISDKVRSAVFDTVVRGSGKEHLDTGIGIGVVSRGTLDYVIHGGGIVDGTGLHAGQTLDTTIDKMFVPSAGIRLSEKSRVRDVGISRKMKFGRGVDLSEKDSSGRRSKISKRVKVAPHRRGDISEEGRDRRQQMPTKIAGDRNGLAGVSGRVKGSSFRRLDISEEERGRRHRMSAKLVDTTRGIAEEISGRLSSVPDKVRRTSRRQFGRSDEERGRPHKLSFEMTGQGIAISGDATGLRGGSMTHSDRQFSRSERRSERRSNRRHQKTKDKRIISDGSEKRGRVKDSSGSQHIRSEEWSARRHELPSKVVDIGRGGDRADVQAGMADRVVDSSGRLFGLSKEGSAKRYQMNMKGNRQFGTSGTINESSGRRKEKKLSGRRGSLFDTGNLVATKTNIGANAGIGVLTAGRKDAVGVLGDGSKRTVVTKYDTSIPQVIRPSRFKSKVGQRTAKHGRNVALALGSTVFTQVDAMRMPKSSVDMKSGMVLRTKSDTVQPLPGGDRAGSVVQELAMPITAAGGATLPSQLNIGTLNFASGLSGASMTGAAMTGQKGKGCAYQDRVYGQDDTWYDGCELQCFCLNAVTGFYRCTSRCRIYTDLPTGCMLSLPAGEECCQQLDCSAAHLSQGVVGAMGGAMSGTVGGALGREMGGAMGGAMSGTVGGAVGSPWIGGAMGGAVGGAIGGTVGAASISGGSFTNGDLISGPGGGALSGGVGCLYNGNVHRDNATWYDGCDYECHCENGNTGFYRCKNRCPIYTNIPAGCSLTLPPGEECCNMLQCPDMQLPEGQASAQVSKSVFLNRRGAGGKQRMEPIIENTNLHKGVSAIGGQCYYKGVHYAQAEQWYDGCDYSCRCENAHIGFYRCRNRCPIYTSYPPGCVMRTPPGECCAVLDCPEQTARSDIFVMAQGQAGIDPIQVSGESGNVGGMSMVNAKIEAGSVGGAIGQKPLVMGTASAMVTAHTSGGTGNMVNTGQAMSIGSTHTGQGTQTGQTGMDSLTGGRQTGQTGMDSLTGGSLSMSAMKTSSMGNMINGGGQGGVSGRCLYNGNLYDTGETWEDGCSYKCVCENGRTGKYFCTSRCPIFTKIPPGCTLTLPLGEKCCEKLECPKKMVAPASSGAPSTFNLAGNTRTGGSTARHRNTVSGFRSMIPIPG